MKMVKISLNLVSISIFFWSELGLNFANISLNSIVATVHQEFPRGISSFAAHQEFHLGVCYSIWCSLSATIKGEKETGLLANFFEWITLRDFVQFIKKSLIDFLNCQ